MLVLVDYYNKICLLISSTWFHSRFFEDPCCSFFCILCCVFRFVVLCSNVACVSGLPIFDCLIGFLSHLINRRINKPFVKRVIVELWSWRNMSLCTWIAHVGNFVFDSKWTSISGGLYPAVKKRCHISIRSFKGMKTNQYVANSLNNTMH